MRHLTGRAYLSATTILAALAWAPSPALAVLATPPSSTQPGVVIHNLDREDRKHATLDSIVTTPPEQDAGKGLSKEKVFELKKVVIDGSTVYDSNDIRSTYSDLVGAKVSFADLNVLAQRVTKKYREDGYIFSYAVLPPQKVSDGTVHLRAVEGHISSVKLVGTYQDKNGLIQKYADRIDTQGAANTKEIERYLLLMNDLPGVTAKSFIKPSSQRGGGDLIINVEEKQAEGSVSVDNRGSDYLGPYRGTVVAALNDALGLHDRTTVRGIMTAQTREMKFVDVTHEEQVGSDGAKILGRVALTGTAPGGNVKSQQIEGDSQMFDLEGQYPLVRSRQYNVSLNAGFNALDSHTYVTQIETANDRVRTLRLGTRMDATDGLLGVNQLDLTATQGLTNFGATNDGTGQSRANGHHDFLKGVATLTRVQQLPGLFSAMVSGTAQVSNEPLLASEEFSIGGPDFGRAYDSGEMTGDSGFAGLAELRYGGPIDSNPYLQSYQAYTFVDYGQVRNQGSTGVGEVLKDSQTSAGLGIRFNAAHDLTGYVELDKPLNKPVASEGNEDSRLFFSVLKRF